MAGLSLAIRTVHVLAAATLLGGAVAVWWRARRGSATGLATARTYEWAFWGLLGVLVATGVGNLGALGPPGPATPWGRALGWKLGLVLVLLVGSLVRTAVVLRLSIEGRVDAATRRLVGRSYGLTALVLGGLVVLAEVLAHG